MALATSSAPLGQDRVASRAGRNWAKSAGLSHL